MTFNTEPAALVNMAGGLALIALGVFVAALRPRRRPNTYLAIFVIGFGFRNTTFWLVPLDDPLIGLMLSLAAVGDVAGAAALLLLGRALRERWHLSDRRAGRAALGVGLLTVAGMAVALAIAWSRFTDAYVVAFSSEQLARVSLISAPSFYLTLGSMIAFQVFMALSYAATGPTAHIIRRDCALMGTGLLLYTGVIAGAGTPLASVFGPTAIDSWFFGGLILLHVLLAGLWLRSTRLATGGRTARNLALLSVAVPLFGMIAAATGLKGWGIFGITRLVMVIIFTYAILRHQVLGIDARARITVRQSTIAAIFIAVFFAVSEGAENLFSSQVGPVLGIAAAAVLVFALAPLQRFAENVARHAVPDAGPVEELSNDEKHRIYRDMARAAWADGHLSMDERQLLESLRARLGLDPERAADLERAVHP